MTDFSIHSDIAQKSSRTPRMLRLSRIILKVLWDFRIDSSTDLSTYNDHIHRDLGLERQDSDRRCHTLGIMSPPTLR